MAPPIKQENLPALEDCRLLLKNAVNVKLKASANFTTPWRSLFFGTVCQGLTRGFLGDLSVSLSLNLIRGGLITLKIS
jgi:hypothetical protein